MRIVVCALVYLYALSQLQYYILHMLNIFKVSDRFGESVLTPVDSRSDAEQAGRSQVLQDSDESLELVTQSCTSCWVGQCHCEGFIPFWLSIQNSPDLQHLKQQGEEHLMNQKYVLFKT